MKAVRLFKPGDLRVEEVEIPSIEKDEVLVKVMAVGVCGSDIPRINYFGAHVSPITVGHEFSGEIVQIGESVEEFSIGDRITAPPLIPCFECKWCKAGFYSLCDNYDYYGSRRDGAMAEYVAVKKGNLLKLSDNMSFVDGATIDPCANASHALSVGEFKIDDTVCVYGAGPIGLYLIKYAKALGAKKIIAVDILKEKLEIAKKVGADITINSLEQNPVEEIYKMTENLGANLIVDLSGVPEAQHSAIESASKRGRVVFLGISHKGLDLNEKAVDSILRKELNIRGSWNSFTYPYPGKDWTDSIKLFQDGKIDSKYIISHKCSLDEAPEIFKKIRNRELKFNKIMFFPWGVNE